VNTSAPQPCFRKVAGLPDDHEFLDIQAVVRVRAAVTIFIMGTATAWRPDRQVAVHGSRFFAAPSDCHETPALRGAEARPCVGASVQQVLSRKACSDASEAHDGFGILCDVFDCLQHALAALAAGFAVAQFDRLRDPRPPTHCGAAIVPDPAGRHIRRGSSRVKSRTMIST